MELDIAYFPESTNFFAFLIYSFPWHILSKDSSPKLTLIFILLLQFVLCELRFVMLLLIICCVEGGLLCF